MSKLKNFVYELSFVALPHNKDTVKKALGTDFYNPDFPEDVHARYSLNSLFQDAITHCLEMQMRLLTKQAKKQTSEEKILNNRVYKNLEMRRNFYEQLSKEIKLVRVEDTTVKKCDDKK